MKRWDFLEAVLSPRACLRVCAVFAALAPCAAFPQAQHFPNHPIRWVIPVAPAGSSDNLARMMQPAVADVLGQPIVIDNRPGGSSVIGTEIVVNASPDGHTLLLVTTTHSVNPSLLAKLPYDTLRDIASVSLLVSQPNFLVVNPSVPAKSVKELIDLARAKPDTLNFASGGNGSSPHLSGELLKLVTGVKITHIPFKGTGPAMVDLFGGHVQMMFVGPIAVETYIKAGRLRALAVAAAKRNAVFPDVPTMAEAGVRGVETGTWYALLAPPRTPKPTIDTLYKSFVKVLQQPAMKQKLDSQGVDIIGSTPEELTAHIKAEMAKWAQVIKAANVRAD